jgi:hypothetical protein
MGNKVADRRETKVVRFSYESPVANFEKETCPVSGYADDLSDNTEH